MIITQKIVLVIAFFFGLEFLVAQPESSYVNVYELKKTPDYNRFLRFTNSVCKITVNALSKKGEVKIYYSSGVLINNSEFDGRMLILTTAHSILHEDYHNPLTSDGGFSNSQNASVYTLLALLQLNAENTTFQFFYEKEEKENGNSTEIIDKTPLTVSGGAKVLAYYPTYKTNDVNWVFYNTDLVLLELNETPTVAESKGLVYAGWSLDYPIENNYYTDGIVVHHPQGWQKKVSKLEHIETGAIWESPSGEVKISGFDGYNPPPHTDTNNSKNKVMVEAGHLDLEDKPLGYYDIFKDDRFGLLQQGSSGAPLFTRDGKVIAITSRRLINNFLPDDSNEMDNQVFSPIHVFEYLTRHLFLNNPNTANVLFSDVVKESSGEFASLQEFLSPNDPSRTQLPSARYCNKEFTAFSQAPQNRLLTTYAIDEDLTDASGNITASEQITISANITNASDLHIKSKEVTATEGVEIPIGSNVTITSGSVNGIGCVTGCYGIDIEQADLGKIYEDNGSAYILAKNVAQIDYLSVTPTFGGMHKQLLINSTDPPQMVNNHYERINLFDLNELTTLVANGVYHVEVHLSNDCTKKELGGTLTIPQGSIDSSRDYEMYAEAELQEAQYLLQKEALLKDAFQAIGANHGFDAADDINLAVDEQMGIVYGMGYRLDGGFNESTIADELLFFLDDFQIFTDIRETQFGIDNQEDLEATYSYEPLTMDLYYPRYNENYVGVKPELPLILYVPTGSYLFEADTKLTKELGRWFANKGYVFAALHTRKGMSITNGELTKRALFREWQDIRAAIQYWELFDSHNSSNWRINRNKIYTLGHGSGGISVLSQATMSLEQYNTEKKNGFLRATTGDYKFITAAEDILFNLVTDHLDARLKKWEERIEEWCEEPDLIKKFVKRFNIIFPNESLEDDISCTDLKNTIEDKFVSHLEFSTYDLNEYPSYPCVNNTTNNPCTDNAATYYHEDELAQPKKAAALAAAIPKLEWLAHISSDDSELPVRVVYHEKDQVISPEEGEPFGDFLYILEEADWYFNSTEQFPRYFGGELMKSHYDDQIVNSPNHNVFDVLKLDGEWNSGGPPRHHYPQIKIGLQYGINDGFEPIIEPKVLYYIDAFFTKQITQTPIRRLYSTENKENIEHSESVVVETNIVTQKLETEKEESLVLIPNPASDSINVVFNVPTKRIVEVRLYNLLGVQLIQKTFLSKAGTNTHRLDTAVLSTGTYLIKVSGPDIDSSALVAIEKK